MLTKKNILIFSTAYFPFVGGAEVAVKEITNRLGDNFEFDLITARLDKKLSSFEKIGNVNVYRIGSGSPTLDKILLPFRGARMIAGLNKKRNYYCFWGVMASFSSGAAYIYNLFSRKKIPIILTLQEGDSEEHLSYRWFGLIALSWKLALRYTTVLTAISTFLIARAKKNGFSGEAVLVPNGVDLDIFSVEISDEIKRKISSDLGKKDEDVYLVTVGRLTHKNGTDDVIRSLPLLPKNINFIVIGKGDEGPKLQKLADSLGVSERVKFLGFVPYEKIPEYLSVCDIFIRASRSEGFGNAFIEAMATGLPVIATPVGGIPDFLDDRETGLFCAPNNPKSIALAVEAIIDDKRLKEALVAKAKSRVVERYNWSLIAKGMGGVFDRLS